MQSRLHVRGNGVEPVLLMFPLGLLAVAVLLDLFHAAGGPDLLGTLAYCTVAAGLLSGSLSTIVVRLDHLATGRSGPARPATIRFLLDGGVLLGFAVILLLRMRTPERTAGPGLLLLELAGLGMAGAGTLIGAALPGPGPARTSAETVRLAQILGEDHD
ncbi:DUF2231 domain-containing protein [Pseudosporangium ferrugineum]|uniref:DUF2231 domain-containing protein n=1 Tax=Pseudosporangium ferrugineum TaxID=439699 RepID=A0A2T0SBQ5_9ACTN|nr:DUF2231 domain-containing protein [Pseudosporangium ferrugineum]PRY30848.1 hypothetical protein CLV70_104400 [Pseudosporangium ferrugineum]